jgi:hypothetical protein
MVTYLDAERGRHESGNLNAHFSVDEFLDKWGDDSMINSPAIDIHHYLSRAGTLVDREFFQSGAKYCGIYVYHYAGGTVSVRYKFETHLFGKAVAGDLSINIEKEDAVGDIPFRLCQRFPYLNYQSISR